MTGAPPSSPRDRLAAPALWLLGLLVAFHPALASGFAVLQIPPGDPRLVEYVLEHGWRWLTGAPLHGAFWSPPVFHPARNVGAYTDTLVGSAPLYWVWRALGVETGAAFQLWIMACLSASFGAAHLFFRRCAGFTPWVAAGAAFFFGFGIQRLASFTSPQLYPIFAAALALYALGRALEGERTPRWIALFYAALALQTWSAFYPTFFLLLLLAALALAALPFAEARGRLARLVRENPGALAAGALAYALAVAPMLARHLAASRELGFREYGEVRWALPTLASWLFPGKDHLFYGGLAQHPWFQFESFASQHSNGLGFLTSAVCAMGLWVGRRRALVRVAVVAAAGLVLVATRPPGGGDSLWHAVYAVLPGAKAIRYPARIGLFLPLLGGLGVGLLATHLVARGRAAWALALCALCIAEQLHRLSGEGEGEYRAAIRRAAAEVDPACDGFVLTVEDARPGGGPFSRTHAAAMWVGLEAGVPTLNGWYGNFPPGWHLYSVDVTGPNVAASLREAISRWIAERGLDDARVQRVRVPAAWFPWHRAASRADARGR